MTDGHRPFIWRVYLARTNDWRRSNAEDSPRRDRRLARACRLRERRWPWLQRARDEPLVPPGAGDDLGLSGRQGREALARGDDRHAPDEDDRRGALRRRRRPPLPLGEARGADDRLVHAGWEGKRLVLRRDDRRARPERQGEVDGGHVAGGARPGEAGDLHACAPPRRAIVSPGVLQGPG